MVHEGTPDYVFAWADKQWGPFDIDLCASPWNAKCPIFITAEQNYLKWAGYAERAWQNPPWQAFPGIRAFVQQNIANVKTHYRLKRIVMHVPSRTGQAWWKLAMCNASEVCYIQGRIKYEPRPGEPKKDGGFEDSVFFVFDNITTGPIKTTFVKRDDMKRWYREMK